MGYIPWDGWITLALFFVGMGAGSFIYATFLWLQNAQTLTRPTLLGWSIAPFATGLGLMILLIDLGRPERFLNALFHFNPHSILNNGLVGSIDNVGGVLQAHEVPLNPTPDTITLS